MKNLPSLLLFLMLLISGTAFSQEKINLSGTWLLDVQTDLGSGTPTFVLKQEGEKITGTYSGTLGEAPLTGTLKGNVIHIQFLIDGNLITYDGTASPSEISGKVNLAEMASGTFKGKRK
ncbi:MAG: hypothetical protein LPK25_16455 [Cyclobacteriaceae bacterium]|nr:hypothetical protein [Cyclobacteriaceae bacterium]MDX5467953.1 hypothetical protein [Cyclobacteriaceae bacterium]